MKKEINKECIDQILLLRKDGLGYKKISKLVGVSPSIVRYYCKKNGLDGIRAENPLVDEAYDRFINGFNNKYGQHYEYVSGFSGSESIITIKCLKCDYQFTRSAQISRKNKKIICKNCKNILKTKEKEERIRKKAEEKELKLKLKKLHKEMLAFEVVCAECGEIFKSNRKTAKYCSEKCQKRKRNRVGKLRRRKKLKSNGEIQEDITIEKLIKRDNNICYLCGEKCDSNDYKINTEGYFIVGHKYPSVEHVIPVANGGTHTWDNVKLSHHQCNSIKGTKEIIKISQ